MWQRLLDFLSIKRVEIKLIPGKGVAVSKLLLAKIWPKVMLPEYTYVRVFPATIKASIHDMQ